MNACGLLPGFRNTKSHLLGLFVLLSVLTLSACGSVNSVRIYDHARVLNTSQVNNAASRLPNDIDIYTTNTFQGTKSDFQRTASAKLGGNPNRIVVAIDTTHHYLYIARGSSVPLSGAGISQAVRTFASNYQSGDYTGATVAALDSMGNALHANRGPAYSPILFCCLPLVLLSLIPVVLKLRRPGSSNWLRGFGSRRGSPQPYYPSDQEGYGPRDGYGSYGPGPQGGYGSYGPGPQGGYGPPQRGGMNPWAAGGLGAAAGGLAGYELGRRQAERNEEERDFGGGGSFGNSEERDFGGGGSFGDSGERDFGGGGSFGNSEERDFGGGGNFGNDMGGGGNFDGDFDNGGGGNF